MSTALVRELKLLCVRQQPVLTIAVAESLTGGRIQAAITARSGASEFFLGGITAYNLEQKVKNLGVKRTAAALVNSVSAEVATQMAKGAARLFNAQLTIATTGYAEPDIAQGVADPLAYWSIAHRITARRWHVLTGRIVCLGQRRNEVQATVTEAVLAELVAYLHNFQSELKN